MSNLLALIEALGTKALPLLVYLVAHKDQIQQLLELLTTLFSISVPKTAVSDEEFIAACKRAGCATGDAQELLAAVSK